MGHGGKLLVDCLVALGATKAFGVPGESYLPVLDAMHDTGGAFDYVLCRQEGGAAFMAAAWGKLTGSPGICMVTRGPGATNASIGVHTAMQDSSPMILFVGQVATDMKGREAFQELDYRAVFGTMAKWVTEIDRVERIPELIARAWTTAVSGRPGPVVVALPEDVLSAETDVAPLPGPIRIAEPAPDAGAVEAALTLLSGAQRPLALIGGGAWSEEGKAAFQRFAEASNLPVLTAFRFMDRIDNHTPVYVGEAGVGMLPHARRLMREADVILALNVRFGENTTDGYELLSVPIPQQKLIHVHISGAEIGKIYQAEVGLVAGPNAFAKALRPVQGQWADWTARARGEYEASFDLPPQPPGVDMRAVMAQLQGGLAEDAILTNGAGNFAIWSNKYFRFGPRQRLLAPQSGAMGYGLPAAIAAGVARPGRQVICFAGDGDFQMTCQELATAVQAGVRPVVLLLNNGIYGTIRAHQERRFPARVSGTTMVNPDFAALARSYGLMGERVETTDGFAPAFARALAAPLGAVLDIAIPPEALSPRATLSAMRAQGLAAQGLAAQGAKG
jgi:acetolactate synthase I/II/III large subunit